MMKRAHKLRTEITKYWQQYPDPELPPLSSTEWKHIDYLIEILHPFEQYTNWAAKTNGPTIHLVFEIYNMLFDHIDRQIEKLQRKRLAWKVKMRQALETGRDKLSDYYAKTTGELGKLYSTATILNPQCKLDYFKEDIWEDFESTTGKSWVSFTILR
jgi:hypothetical protein